MVASRRSTSHIERVRSSFSRQARDFDAAGLTLGRQELLDWITAALPLTPMARALDVAAGTCHLSRAVAPRVRSVAAVDVTPAMLREARAEIADAQTGNLHLVQADAGRLPFPDQHFDLVMCRLAIHHFADPAVEVAEMARVARESGTLAIVDLLSPDDGSLAERYNAFERMRDPSHTRALTARELLALLTTAGRPVSSWTVREVEVELDSWFELTRTPASARRTVAGALALELDGGPSTGMRPRQRAGRLSFVHTWGLVQAGPLGRSVHA